MDAGIRWIEADWERFDPWRISPVRHCLQEHPLLNLGKLQALGDRLEDLDCVRTHSSGAKAETPFNDAPRLHPNRRSAVDTLAHIQDAQAWLSLLNIQVDAEYRSLVDGVLEQLRPAVERRDPGMSYKGGWIFVTSPNAVTPFHMDKEHNFIVQIQGTKTLYVWEPDDRNAVSEAARDRFHATHSRELVRWRNELKATAQVFQLRPGQGAYMPSTSPHLVENGPGPSITASFTYYTHATRRNSALHAAHQWLRERGVEPAPVGKRALADLCLYAIARAARALARTRRRLVTQGPVRSDFQAYADRQVG